MQNIIDINLQMTGTGHKKNIKDINGCASSLIIAELAKNEDRNVLVVTRNIQEATVLEQELIYFIGKERVWYFPDPETLPYDSFSPHKDIISRRLEIMYQLTCRKGLVVIVNITTLMGKLPPVEFILRESFLMKTGDKVDIPALKKRLTDAGYYSVQQVFEHGEFTTRGSIIDLFPMGSNHPYRIDFFDDEIDTISIFDVETQRSIKTVPEIKLLPAHEFPFDDSSISLFRANYREQFSTSTLPNHLIYQSVSKHSVPSGIEYYMPLFFKEEPVSLFSYLQENAVLVLMEDLTPSAEGFYRDVTDRAGRFLGNPEHPSLKPDMLFLTLEKLRAQAAGYDTYRLFTDSDEAPRNAVNAGTQKLPPLALNQSLDEPFEPFIEFLNGFNGRTLLTVETEGRKSILYDLLHNRIKYAEAESFAEFLEGTQKFAVTVAPVSSGAIFNGKIAVITENELLGTASVTRRSRSRRNRNFNQDAIIKNLAELKIGDRIVHEQFGIGAYEGLKVLTIDGIKTEFVSLNYADDAKMFIPITSLYLLSRYSGPEEVKLTKLGTDAWKKARDRAASKIRDVAASLLDIYAKRKMKHGIKYTIDKSEYADFASGFKFQPTEDQQKAIDSVISDMCSDKPMDRLVCGDVGFGKTEVAMRAAFIAASSGRQVVILVPTTLLADQHYESFRDRFARTPLVIECLSRFNSSKTEKDILNRIADGSADIIIGTHKLLGKNIKYKNLGLLIIDEEHRFGVSQKEKIKELRAEVDILTMTATPIPRTLNMSLSGIRDLSIIATPPAKRLAVRTFVHENSDSIIREAISRELKRGGQCYYLHNDVKSINITAEKLAELVPDAKIAVAHAQMHQHELSRIMHDFYRQRINVLVCSTIIETGLDVPTANTIIIEGADRFGLAQLHQLRGRVGRSHHQAYAYLLTPPAGSLSNDAKKRLEAIASLEELGSGFILANQDLEIRGAGEILGDEQSGQIEGIGFNLYMDMLDAAVEQLREGKEPTLENMSHHEVSIELHIPALFPETYIYDISSRLQLYKKLASCHNNEEIDDVQAEVVDRFGPLKPEARNIITLTKLKLLSQKLGVKSIEMNSKYGSIEFGDRIHVNFDYLRSLVLERSNEFRLDGTSKLRIVESRQEPDERIKQIQNILTEMDAHYEK
jgi:transcription-repair coupling factor (superfamily II helicase)